MVKTALKLFYKLKSEIKKSKELIDQKTGPKHVADSISELVFLRVFLAWEIYCEELFLLYLLGGKTRNNKIVKRYVNPRDRSHAYDLTKGLKQYPDWTNLSDITQISNLYFHNGQPFSKLKTFSNSFDELRTLRNAIAHRSKNSEEKFKSLVRKEMGFLPARCSVGSFLLSKKTNGMSYLSHYTNILESAAELIL